LFNLNSIIGFLGGVGLFLLGMRLMTDGLKVAAGGALHGLLQAATKGRFRALAAGAAITALVQSSSAVIFAIIGFVNAGLLTLGQAVGLIFGANLGTTLTSWIVALVGFEIKLALFALPSVALGMALWLTRSGRAGALGQALVGFGVFFLGLDTLKTAFAGIEQGLDPGWMPVDGIPGVLVFALIGALLTVLMQSSSAALAVTLTAASQGLLPLPVAGAMVIGANIGTTSTAVFATLGATAAARRAAIAHVAFNLIAGALALVLLPLMIPAALSIAGVFGADNLPATVLALIHTQVNLLGILAMWPLLPILVKWLQGRFGGAEKSDLFLPRHLDDNVLATPRLAVEAAFLELRRMGDAAHALARGALNQEPGHAAELGDEALRIEGLGTAIVGFVSRINSGGDERIDARLPDALRIAQYYRAMAERGADMARIAGDAERSQRVAEALDAIHAEADHALRCSAPETVVDSATAVAASAALTAFEARYQRCKADLLRAGSRAELRPPALVRELDRISALRRVVEQATKAALLLVPPNAGDAAPPG